VRAPLIKDSAAAELSHFRETVDMTDIIIRAEAKERGLTRYFTGKSCKHGHVCERIVSNRECSRCHYLRIHKQRRSTPERRLKYHRNNMKFRRNSINSWMAHRLRTRLRLSLKNTKIGSAVQDLGCSIEEFKIYISNKFHSGMTWDNRGSLWELDHITRLADFNLKDREQLLRAINYTNYQPLLKEDHIQKTTAENRISI
jgi:hypothetical protein